MSPRRAATERAGLMRSGGGERGGWSAAAMSMLPMHNQAHAFAAQGCQLQRADQTPACAPRPPALAAAARPLLPWHTGSEM